MHRRSVSREQDDLDFLTSSTLTKRKDLDEDSANQSNSGRAYVLKKNADVNRLIQACDIKLQANPDNTRALFTRGSSLVKKGT